MAFLARQVAGGFRCFPNRICKYQVQIVGNSIIGQAAIPAASFRWKNWGLFASFKAVFSCSDTRPTGASSRPSLIVFARARKAHRFVAPPCPTKSLDFAGAPPLWTLCGSVALQRRTLAFFGKGHCGLGQRAGIQLYFFGQKKTPT